MKLHELTPENVKGKRWFQNKGSKIKSIDHLDHINLQDGYRVGIFKISFEDIDPEVYVIPTIEKEGKIFDVSEDEHFCRLLVNLMMNSNELKGERGRIKVDNFTSWKIRDANAVYEAVDLGSSNSMILCKENGKATSIVKLLRRLRKGKSVEAEINGFLAKRTDFKNAPMARAFLTYDDKAGNSYHVATLFDYVENQGSGWEWTLESLKKSLPQLLNEGENVSDKRILEVFSDYNNKIYNLGKVLASLHLAFASGDKVFISQLIKSDDVSTWVNAISDQADRSYSLMKKAPAKSEELVKVLFMENQVYQVIDEAEEVFDRLGQKIRQHGDFHLGQVLVSDDDFYIIDFEGEPLKPYEQRGIRYPALKDAAGMLRSFNYASFSAFFDLMSDYDPKLLKPLCRKWEAEASKSFIEGYHWGLCSGNADFIPLNDMEAMNKALMVLALEKALYEVEYEVNNRPDWLTIPLVGVLDIMERYENESNLFHE